MKNAYQFGSGGSESFALVIQANCRAYQRTSGLIPELVRVSDKGRFKDHIGETVTVQLANSVCEVRIIGGEDSVYTQTVGTI